MRVVGGRLRSRPIAGPKSDALAPDRRPPARIAVQYPDACLRRPGDRRARARPVRRHRRARHRSDLARRGLRAVRRRRRRRRARCCATTPSRSAWAASPAFSGATPPNWVRRIRSSRSRSRSSIRPTARAWPRRRLLARDGGWLTPGALIVVEEAADAGFKAPEGFEELERRKYDDTELVFLRTPERHRRPNSRSISVSFNST